MGGGRGWGEGGEREGEELKAITVFVLIKISFSVLSVSTCKSQEEKRIKNGMYLSVTFHP